MRIHIRTNLLLTLTLSTLAILLTTPQANADLSFCPQGTGAGQCASRLNLSSVRGMAVDHETGRLYVADEGNHRVNVFKDNGEFLFAFGWKVNAATPEENLQTCTIVTGCQKGSAGSGAGQFDRPASVAIDNDSASPSHHDIYVSDRGNFRVQRLDPTGAFVWTVGEGVNKTTSAGLCTKASGNACGAGAQSEAEGGFTGAPIVGLGPSGFLYTLDDLSGPGSFIKQRLQRFHSSGALILPQAILFEGASNFVHALAVDAVGNAWVSSQGEGLRKYSPAGTLLVGPIDSELTFRPASLAFDTAGTLYAGQHVFVKEDSRGFNLLTAYDAAGNILRRFAYTDSFDASDSINGLAAHTSAFGDVFFSRLEGGIDYVSAPPPGPVVPALSVEVPVIGSVKATAVAEVNPEGKATQVHFEYLTEQAYDEQGESFTGGATKSTSTIPLGAEGFALKTTEAVLGCPNPAKEAAEPLNKCLLPETTYRFRVVATNPDGEGEGTVEGPPFTTKKSIEVGDIYATEVGTDTARLNAEVNPFGVPATGYFEYVEEDAFQESGFATASKVPDVDNEGVPLDFGSGEAFVTRSVSIYPLEPGTTYHYRIVADNPLIDPIAGETKTLQTFEPLQAEPCPQNEASRIGPGALLPDCRAYEMVSPLDKAGVDIRVLPSSVSPFSTELIEQSSPSGQRLAYGSARAFGDAASAPVTSQYIAQRIAGQEWRTHGINPPRGRAILSAVQQFRTEFQAFSPDLCEAWIAPFADPPLTEAAVAGFVNLYRRSDRLCGEERYEALAPPFAPSEGIFPELLGVSADGSQAIFHTKGKLTANATAGQRQLYESVQNEALRLVCVLPDGKAHKAGCTAGSTEGGQTLATLKGAISSDGERIFWSDKARGEGRLYVRIGGSQTLAVSKVGEEAAGTAGSSWFWGAAADGSRVIFTTSLTGTSVFNLYGFDVDGEETTLLAKRVRGVMGLSADASRVYFVSEDVLASGATEGKPNLYLQDESTEGGGTEFVATLASADLEGAVDQEASSHTSRISHDGTHAIFASTAPLTGYDNDHASGGIPTAEIYRYDAEADELICASCNPSGARPAGRATIPPFQTGMHAARVLSEDGSRLYFESEDTLVARDTNGRKDVYQWEEEGTGGCDEADAGFSAPSGGCIELISSGQSELDSRFVESSPSGDDVFLATASSLLPQDQGLVDIYDARVGGGLPIPAPRAPTCEGEACQSVPAAPDDPTPASSAFRGAGNVVEGVKPRCAKGKVRRKGRCVGRKQNRSKRANRNRRAAR